MLCEDKHRALLGLILLGLMTKLVRFQSFATKNYYDEDLT